MVTFLLSLLSTAWPIVVGIMLYEAAKYIIRNKTKRGGGND